ncbi:MAG: helix-turn-helix domain-containing protein [Pseudomonadota bacterium]
MDKLLSPIPAPNARPPRQVHRVAVVVCPQHSLGSVGLVLDVFRMGNQLPGAHRFELIRVSEDGHGVPHPDGLLAVEGGPERLQEAELVVIPSLWTQGPEAAASHPKVIAALGALPAGVRVATLCSGVYLLAATGRLDGQVATTHWMLADELQARHPGVKVQPDSNLTQAAGMLCSGGSLAGVDACLRAVQTLADRDTARALARMLVTELDRGPQSLYMPPPGWRRHSDADVRRLQDRIEADVATPLSLQALAEAIHVSVRTLQRRFLAATGTTPLHYQQALRLARAQHLLETARLQVAEVAEAVGYRDRVAFGRLFKKHTGMTPAAWRQRHTVSHDLGHDPGPASP